MNGFVLQFALMSMIFAIHGHALNRGGYSLLSLTSHILALASAVGANFTWATP